MSKFKVGKRYSDNIGRTWEISYMNSEGMIGRPVIIGNPVLAFYLDGVCAEQKNVYLKLTNTLDDLVEL